MKLSVQEDLWSYLKTTKKTIVLYGMGNGADKLLCVAEARGIRISDFFASDGFVRGHSFHGKVVLSYSEVCRKYGKENLIVLLSFATSLDSVMELICRVASETELYAPDLPVTTDRNDAVPEVFDLAYYKAHASELDAADALFADAESHEIFRSVVEYRLSGKISHLLSHESTREAVYTRLLSPAAFRRSADLGAYNGDTVRELLPYAPHLSEVYCMEPDPRNYKKLSAYAESETRCRVIPLPYAAYSFETTLSFDGSGNRNATLGSGNAAGGKRREIPCASLSHIMEPYGSPKLDYIKFDVEGAEREALTGCMPLIHRDRPTLLVSLYHRIGDLYSLPLFLAKELAGDRYRFYLRRFRYIPAWDLNLYAIPEACAPDTP